jgi:hypothetical protein
MPTDQCASEREERLVNVGSLLVPHAQAAKLAQPSKMCAQRPTAIGPGRSHASRGAPRATGEYGEFAGLGVWAPRHTHGHRGCSRDGTVVALAHLGAEERHRPVATPLSSRAGWHRSNERRAAPPARRRSHDACCLAWLGRLDSDQSSRHRRSPARSSYRPLPVTNQSGDDARANRAARSASDPKCRRLAIRAGAASTSSQTRSQVRRATSPTGCPCEGQKNTREARSIRDARSSTFRPSWRNRKQRFEEIP